MSEKVNGTMPYVPVTYPEMLKNARNAKSDRRDTFDWFLRNATSSGAFRMGRAIECRENVAGMTLLFLCMALIKYNNNKNTSVDGVTEELKKHLDALKVMRTSTSVPLCVIPEEEGIMFPGEGMSLRFLNALIILESLFLSKMTGKNVLKENWEMYSSLDLIISLQLPALLGVLNDEEKRAFADKLENINTEGEGSKERRMAAKLIKSTITIPQTTQRAKEEEEDSKFGRIIIALILFVMYTLAVIRFSQDDDYK